MAHRVLERERNAVGAAQLAKWCALCARSSPRPICSWAQGGRTGFVAATGSADLLEQRWFVVFVWEVAFALLMDKAGCVTAVAGWGARLPDRPARSVL